MTPQQADRILDDLCVKLGFCLDASARERFVHQPPADIHQFALAVFAAEGLDPASEKRLFRQVCDRIDLFIQPKERDGHR